MQYDDRYHHLMSMDFGVYSRSVQARKYKLSGSLSIVHLSVDVRGLDDRTILPFRSFIKEV